MMNQKKNNNNMRLFALNSNMELAEKISNVLDVPLSRCEVKRFADGEVQIDIEDSIRNDIIFIIQSTSTPVNENLMELLIFIDALKRASAKEINVVMPYYGYSRQDRKARSRQPITAKLVANMLQVAGADRVVAIDLHASQIQGFFDIPSDHLTAIIPIEKYIRQNLELDNVVVVSPDHGGVKRARNIGKLINAPIAIIDKRRPRPNEAEISSIIGDIEGKTCIMVDDMVDTAGTLTLGAQALMDKGAKKVYAVCVHGILSDPAIQRLNDSVIEKLVITDTIKIPEEKLARTEKIDIISVSDLLATAILNVYNGASITHMFGES
ncbi:MAG: ribose-phosphate diphosphokinase [Mycoplasmatales bacterium]